MDSREALIAFNLIEHVGPVRARLLLEHFGDAPAALDKLSSKSYCQTNG
jgi:DprA-like N-terminal HHH domain